MYRIVKNRKTYRQTLSNGVRTMGLQSVCIRMQMGIQLLVFFIGCLFIFDMNPAYAHPDVRSVDDKTQKKLTIVSIPGLSFYELNEDGLKLLPNILKIVEHGSVGAMNVRTPERGIADSYLTMGSGKASIFRKLPQPMQQEEPWQDQSAHDLYTRFNGELPGPADVLFPAMKSLITLNSRSLHGAESGLLGETLDVNGVARYVFGNSDRGYLNADQGLQRWAPLLLVDRKGTVVHGKIGQETVMNDPARPFGISTNYGRLLEWVRNVSGPAVVLVELGDLDRLYADRANYDPARFQLLKSTILSEIDMFIGALASQDAEHKTGPFSLWIVSPAVNEDASKQRLLLAPWIIYDEDEQEYASVMSSATTRQAGIVANVDFAPTILSLLGIRVPNEMIGHPVIAKASEMHWARFLNELQWIAQVYKLRPSLLYTFVLYEILVLLLGLLAAFIGWRNSLRWLKIPLLSVLIAPLVMLLLGYVHGVSSFVVTVLFVATMFGIAWAAGKMPLIHGLICIAGFNAIVILFDGITGATAMKRSVLGYDVMYGARYYGIGNEFMGVLIGSSILFVSLALHLFQNRERNSGGQRMVRVLIVGGMIGILLYLALPVLGTNAGGAITGTVAFGFACWRWFAEKGEHISLRWSYILASIAVFGLIGIAGLWIMNTAIPAFSDAESHIGRAMKQLTSGDFKTIGNITLRKLSMNRHLIGVSSWSKVLITSLFVMAVLTVRPRGVFRRWQEQYPLIMSGYAATMIGAIIGLAVNDSGIVTAATMIVFVAAPMLLFKLSEL